MIVERRFINSQLRASAPLHFSSSPGTLTSYAATYNTLSSDLGGFKERIANGAFDRSIRNGDDVRCLINHSPDLIVGRTRNGTLRLASDAKGLRTECDLPNTQPARDLYALVQRGDISECSFGFTVNADSWSDEEDPDERGTPIKVRTLRDVRLVDCSYVTYPAYPGTSISATDGAPVRSHSFNEIFPAGVPAEVRSRVGDVRALLERTQDRRRRLVNSVLSI